MLTEDQIARIRKMRTENPLYRMTDAVSLVRYEDAAKDSRYKFLNDIPLYFYPDGTPLAEGKILGGIKAKVEIDYDQDCNIGDDDVTGTFTSEQEPGVIKNTVSYHSQAQNGQGSEWYRPANCRTGDTVDSGGWAWYHKHNGMSKQVAREYNAALIKDDMREDADRTYYDMHVTLTVDHRVIADNWLGGIDFGDGKLARAYAIDTAAEQIRECLAIAQQDIDKKIDAARAHTKHLRKLRKKLNKADDTAEGEL